MSLEIIETGEVVDPMGRVEAERITTRIADLLDGIADNIDQVIPLIREALTRQAWAALEYNGPSDYISERFSGALQRLSPEVRRPFAAELSAAGMSTRAIAPIVGVDQSRVARDLQVMRSASPASPVSPDETETMHGLPTTDRIVGMDGKTYRRPDPAPEPAVIIDRTTGEVTDHQQQPARRRQPLPDAFLHQAIVARKAVEALERLVADDRFPRNKDDVSAVNSRDLTLTKDALQRVLVALTK